MKRLIVILFILAAWSTHAWPMDGPLCPVIEYACYNQDLLSDLEELGARDWELDAIEVITRSSSRSPVAIHDTDCGAAGFAHFSPGNLDLGITWEGSCAYDDEVWRDQILAVLYSEDSAIIQLTAWRRIINQAIRPARRAGCDDDCLVVVASVANSSPTLANELGLATEWDPWEIIDGYEASRPGNLHRERRANRLRAYLLD